MNPNGQRNFFLPNQQQHQTYPNQRGESLNNNKFRFQRPSNANSFPRFPTPVHTGNVHHGQYNERPPYNRTEISSNQNQPRPRGNTSDNSYSFPRFPPPFHSENIQQNHYREEQFNQQPNQNQMAHSTGNIDFKNNIRHPNPPYPPPAQRPMTSLNMPHPPFQRPMTSLNMLHQPPAQRPQQLNTFSNNPNSNSFGRQNDIDVSSPHFLPNYPPPMGQFQVNHRPGLTAQTQSLNGNVRNMGPVPFPMQNNNMSSNFPINTLPPPPFPPPPFFNQPPLQRENPVLPLNNNWNPQQQYQTGIQNYQMSPSGITTPNNEPANQMNVVIEEWLKSKNLEERIISKDESKMKIYEFKFAVSNHLTDLNTLRELNDELAANMDSNDDKWKSLLTNIEQVKKRIEKAKETLFTGKQMENIKQQIKIRKKKRVWQKRRRQQRQQQYLENLKHRINENERIDQWQAEQQRKIKEKKLVETLKNEAGESLQEVKLKSSQATTFIKKLQLLQELREMRKERAIFKGILVLPRDNERFENIVDDVSKMLNHQIDIYNNEEKALRVLREEESEELHRKQVEEQKRRKEKRKSALDKVDPLYNYRTYWTKAQESVAGLIHIRALWDMYICSPHDPYGSRIPRDWVKPVQPSSGEWKKFLVKPDKQTTKIPN